MANLFESQLLKLKIKEIRERPRTIVKFFLTFVTTLFLLHNSFLIIRKIDFLFSGKSSNLDSAKLIEKLLPVIPFIPA